MGVVMRREGGRQSVVKSSVRGRGDDVKLTYINHPQACLIASVLGEGYR